MTKHIVETCQYKHCPMPHDGIVEWVGNGRPPKYCSHNCRQAAYRDKKRLERLEEEAKARAAYERKLLEERSAAIWELTTYIRIGDHQAVVAALFDAPINTYSFERMSKLVKGVP